MTHSRSLYSTSSHSKLFGGNSDSSPILQLNKISKQYQVKGGTFATDRQNVVHALTAISFDLHRGETLGVVGESGSGKSTLMRIIVKAERPTDGNLSYYPTKNTPLHDMCKRKLLPLSINDLSTKETKLYYDQVKIVFQDPTRSLNPRLTVSYILLQSLLYSPSFNIHCDARSYKAKRALALERIHHTLAHLGIDKAMLQRYPTEFSGGQRQRLAIARALIHRPHVLICDEVSSSLDVTTRANMVTLLKELQEAFGFSMLFISHDISLVAYISDTIIVLKNGITVEHAPYQTILHNPKSEYTRMLIARAQTSK